ncbi:CAF17-like 4Fe-4S cluster assembly/insertion protein YgfZ [Marinobacterium marinum]|uniref:Folate-binding protein YgfZ n=1 Tax=Marinobacterium marinum TaxID=2756129 RepID=A0A7W1X0B2_9GAMM|nr:folate-binding protein YgfZ [Marinobacterium marinum]MBA4503523.1 folate-binding protein YgfZ [Marinobacterium marinum]
MHALWREWLNQPGIELKDDRVITTPAHDRSTTVVPLTEACIISVSGPDAHKFLQGQLSCDLADVDRLGSLPGAHCNIKGHMHSLYQVIRAEEARYWLRTRSSMAADALALLKKYIIFSKADAVQQDDLLGIGLCGPNAVSLTQQLEQAIPDASQARHDDTLSEFWFPAERLEEVMSLATATAGLGNSNAWELAAVDAAIPDLFPATREAFIPQMTNLQAFDGVSFTKGCYTGQEIVTRLQHRGQLKRPMYLAEIETAQPPTPGMPLASDNRANVGQLVRVAQCGEQRYRVLAVIIKEQAEQQSIHLEDAEGAQLQLMPLPYVLDPRLFESKR